MSKIEELSPVSASYGGITKVNANFAKIETAFQNTLSRDGSTPNTMEADLDMNSKRIVNLPAPLLDNEPATKSYVDDALTVVYNLSIADLNDGELLQWLNGAIVGVDPDTLGGDTGDGTIIATGSTVARTAADRANDFGYNFVDSADAAEQLARGATDATYYWPPGAHTADYTLNTGGRRTHIRGGGMFSTQVDGLEILVDESYCQVSDIGLVGEGDYGIKTEGSARRFLFASNVYVTGRKAGFYAGAGAYSYLNNQCYEGCETGIEYPITTSSDVDVNINNSRVMSCSGYGLYALDGQAKINGFATTNNDAGGMLLRGKPPESPAVENYFNMMTATGQKHGAYRTVTSVEDVGGGRIRFNVSTDFKQYPYMNVVVDDSSVGAYDGTHEIVDCDLTWFEVELAFGGTATAVAKREFDRVWKIDSVTDNLDGTITFHTTEAHNIPYYSYVARVFGTTASRYDADWKVTEVTDTSFTVVATFLGTDTGFVSINNWDLNIDSLTSSLLDVNDMLFSNGNFNYTRIGKGYNITFVGTRLKEQVWLEEGARIWLIHSGRGRWNNSISLDDVPLIGGPGSSTGIGEIFYSNDDNSYTGGGAIKIRVPNRADGVGANMRPVSWNTFTVGEEDIRVAISDTEVLTVTDGQVAINGTLIVDLTTIDGQATWDDAQTFKTNTQVGNGTGSATFKINGGAATSRVLGWYTNSVLRWRMYVNAVAESGSNAGSKHIFDALSDTGTVLGNVWSVDRATQVMTFTQPVAGQTPTSSSHLATKSYVDSLVTGLQVKTAVGNATTANISLTGEQTIDGVLTATSRILVKNQSAPAENGIYVTAAGAWARATDMDTWTETVGALVPVTAGTANANTIFASSTAAGGTLGVTSVTFAQFISTSGLQPLDSDLTTISAATNTAYGLGVLTVADAAALRTYGGLVIGTDVQGYDADVAALAANATNGIWVRTGAGTGSARTITGTSNEITVTNGNGVSGNPTLSLPTSLTFTGKTVAGGAFSSPEFTNTPTGIDTLKMSLDVSSPAVWSSATTRRHMADRGRDRPSLLDWAGVTLDGTTSDVAGVQDAIDEVAAAGGGFLDMPTLNGAYGFAKMALDGTITLHGGVYLRGRGLGGGFGTASADGAKEIKWTGATDDTAVMVKLGFQGTTGYGGGLEGFRVSGVNKAGTLIAVKDQTYFTIKDITGTGGRVAGVDITNTAGQFPTGFAKLQNIHLMMRGTTVADTATGLWLHGTDGVTNSIVDQIRIEHANGHGVKIEGCADAFLWNNFYTFRSDSETGYAISVPTGSINLSGHKFTGCTCVTGGINVVDAGAVRGWTIDLLDDWDIASSIAAAPKTIISGAGGYDINVLASYSGRTYGNSRYAGNSTMHYGVQDSMAFRRYDSTNTALITANNIWKTGGVGTPAFASGAQVGGTVELTTSAASGDISYFTYFNTASTEGLTKAYYPAMKTRVYQPAQSSVVIRVGWLGDFGATNTNGIYWEYDDSISSFWRMVCKAAGTATTSVSAINSLTAVDTLHLDVTEAGASFYYTAGTNYLASTPVTITTNLPTVQLSPTYWIKTAAAATKTLRVYDHRHTGTVFNT